jgi:hypothetical protein
MLFIRSLASKCLACHSKLIAVILLLGEIMPTCSYYAEKGLVYITITALSNYQPSSCSKYIKLNMHLSYNIYSMSNAKYACFTVHLYTL